MSLFAGIGAAAQGTGVPALFYVNQKDEAAKEACTALMNSMRRGSVLNTAFAETELLRDLRKLDRAAFRAEHNNTERYPEELHIFCSGFAACSEGLLQYESLAYVAQRLGANARLHLHLVGLGSSGAEKREELRAKIELEHGIPVAVHMLQRRGPPDDPCVVDEDIDLDRGEALHSLVDREAGY